MKVDDIKLVKFNQDYTCEEAMGKIGVIETTDLGVGIRIRIQRNDYTHMTQWVQECHLEDI